MSGDTLLAGVTRALVETPRLRTQILVSGAESGVPVFFIHGNASGSRFWEETLAALPADYRGIAPDLRGFGGSETKPIDATRGLRDYADDLRGLVETLGLGQVHLIGWSLGGNVAMQYALDHPGAYCIAGVGRARLALRLRRDQGHGGHADLAQLRRFRRRDGESGVRATPKPKLR